MAGPIDLLRRFRLVAVPGQGGRAGVPVDRAAVLREELAPVFAALRDAGQRANEIVARATTKADRLGADAVHDAQQLLDEAREAQPGTRAGAASDVHAQAISLGEAIRAAAELEVQRLDREVSPKIAPLVEDIVQRVLATGRSPQGTP